MCDGTFFVAPSGCRQLFIIMGKVSNLWIPLVYFVMRSKKMNDYYYCLQILLDKCNELNIDINEKVKIYLDFEKASSNAFKTFFPDCAIHRCYVHLWRCVNKQINKKGLAMLFKHHKDFSTLVRKLVGLSFLPVEEVSDAFFELRREFPAEANLFLDYFEKNFVRGPLLRQCRNKFVYSNARYPVDEWNMNWRLSNNLQRSTNVIEGLNNRLKENSTYGSHPSMHNFSKLILTEIMSFKHKLTQHLINGAEVKVSKKRREIEQHLKNLVIKDENGEIFRHDFLVGIQGNIV